jgi:oxygen-independent coproporphyrinogen-3 oxidase
MIGIPGQDLERVREDARRLVEAGASHLSIYMLDLDKTSPLKTEVDAGLVALPSDDEVATAFELLQEELPSLGFSAYEISNYARPGEESLHNSRYWERRPYLGIGPGAASHLGAWRWSEDPRIEPWALGLGDRELQELDAAGSLAEIPLLGLRMRKGVDWDRLRRKAREEDLSPLVETWEKELAPFFTHGLLEREGPVLRLTRKGVLLSNRVLEVFI